MTPTKCPRCGTLLLKEKAKTAVSNGGGGLIPKTYKGSGSHNSEGSVDVFSNPTTILECPKCGYLFVEW
ncbi:MAG: hypothetical protein WBV70_02420 [Candidatus Bathyarchaeia archaeon]